MPRRCCVPGCKANYDSTLKKNQQCVTTFSFPKNGEARSRWLRAIPRKDWIPSPNAVVCCNHFHEEDIIRYDKYLQPDGSCIPLALRHPKLKKDAIPSRFPRLPAKPKRLDPKTRRRNILKTAVAAPSTSSTVPPKKRACLGLGHLCIAEKQHVLNMFKSLELDRPKKRTTAIVSNIANTTGVAKSTVYRVIREYRQKGHVDTPKEGTGRHSVIDTYGETVKDSVKKIIYGFLKNNEVPTVNKVLNEIKDRPDLPQMSRSTLYKLMKQINSK